MHIAAVMTGLVIALSLAISLEAKPMDSCRGKAADVVFVLDVSSSIWPKHFKEHVLTFVHEVVDSLPVGPGVDQARVGAVTFSDEVWLEFHLNQFMEKDQLLERVAKIESRGGNTDTHEALEFVDLNLFKEVKGARQNTSRIVIVITDGASRKVKATMQAAATLRGHGATIFAIGVGNKVNVQQLKDIASKPSGEFVFEVTNFQVLDSIKSELVTKTCKVQVTTTPEPTTTTTTTTTTPTTTTTTPTTTTTTPTTTTTTPTTTTTTPTTTTTTPTTTTTTPPTTTMTEPSTTTTEASTTTEKDPNMKDGPQGDVDTVACINRPADVYFVLDSSSSIWIHDFQTNVLGFVRDVIDIFDVSRESTRVGVITFSDTPRTVFGLDSHVHKDELLKAVNKDNVLYTPGLTYTAEAIQQARMNLFREGRKDVNQIVILMTDGQSKDPNATVHVARAARNDGITLFAVGIGEGVDAAELHAVASRPSEDFVLMVDDFNSLTSKKALLAARTCGSKATMFPPVKPLKDGDSSRECYLQNADVLVAYDSSMVGGIVSTQITSTLHRVSATLDAWNTDVTLGTMTSSDCVEQQSAPLSSSLVFGKYVNSVTRSQTSQMTSVLKSVRMSGFSAKNGHRVSAKKVLVIILDPSSTSKLTQLAREAAKIRGDDVEVFVVTSGRQGGQLVQDMVSEPKLAHVIRLPALDFSNYAYATDVIVKSLCRGEESWQY